MEDFKNKLESTIKEILQDNIQDIEKNYLYIHLNLESILRFSSEKPEEYMEKWKKKEEERDKEKDKKSKMYKGSRAVSKESIFYEKFWNGLELTKELEKRAKEIKDYILQ